MKRYLFIVAVGLAAATSVFANTGSSAGNGTDHPDPYYQNAWFGGSGKTARYCYTIAPAFGVEEAQAVQALEWAFQTWVDYIRMKHLSAKVTLASRLERLAQCDGSEELRVYFGTSDETVEKLRRGYSDPIAFAEKTEYDAQTGWGRGVLWMSLPRQIGFSRLSWNDGDKLKGALLHEMGHIFGCAHISETIMDRELGAKLLGEGGTTGGALNLPLDRIDGKYRELAICKTCVYELESNTHQQLQTRFETLMGRASVGKAHATLTFTENWGMISGSIRLYDDAGSNTFEFQVQKDIVWRNPTESSFKFLAPIPENGSEIFTGSGVKYGWMRMPDGTKRPISFARNMSYYVEIVDLDGDVLVGREDDSDFFHGGSYKILN